MVKNIVKFTAKAALAVAALALLAISSEVGKAQLWAGCGSAGCLPTTCSQNDNGCTSCQAGLGWPPLQCGKTVQ